MEIEHLPCATPWLTGSQKLRLYVSLSRPTLRDILQMGTPKERGIAYHTFLKARRWHTGGEWMYPPRHVASLRFLPEILRRLVLRDISRSRRVFPAFPSLLARERDRRNEDRFGKPCMIHLDLTKLEMQGLLTRRGHHGLTSYIARLVMTSSLLSGRPMDRSEIARNAPRFSPAKSKGKFGDVPRSCDLPTAHQIQRAIEYQTATPYPVGGRNGWTLYSARWMGSAVGHRFYSSPDLWVASIFMGRNAYWPCPIQWNERWCGNFERYDPLPAKLLRDPDHQGLWENRIEEDFVAINEDRGDLDGVDLGS